MSAGGRTYDVPYHDPPASDLLALHALVFPISVRFGRLPRRLQPLRLLKSFPSDGSIHWISPFLHEVRSTIDNAKIPVCSWETRWAWSGKILGDFNSDAAPVPWNHQTKRLLHIWNLYQFFQLIQSPRRITADPGITTDLFITNNPGKCLAYRH